MLKQVVHTATTAP